MYMGDFFFTLGTFWQAGLLILSTALASLCLIVINGAARVNPVRRWFPRLALTWLLFWLFVWLSPQIYYTYYQFAFTGLPQQIVIHEPPSLTSIVDLLTFDARPTLADHGRGLLGWALLIFTVIRFGRETDRPHR